MAQSKHTSLSGSLTIGSAEDFDHSCDSCLSDGNHIEAHGYCVDCKEYLCTICFNVHKRTTLSRHHQLLDKDNIDKQGVPKQHSNKCTERCSIHTDEVIKYFCPQHKNLACHDCVILHHKDCEMDYIPEKCSGIGESEEYKRTIWLLDMKLKEIDYVAKKATGRGNAIDAYHGDLIKRIDQFEKEIINRIRQIRKQIEAEIDKKKSECMQVVKGVFHACTNMSAEITSLQSRLQVSQTKTQNGQMYIAIKRAEAKLKLDEIKETTGTLDRINTQYTFEPNKKLQKMLSKNDGFGMISLSILPTQIDTVDSITNQADINVRTHSVKEKLAVALERMAKIIHSTIENQQKVQSSGLEKCLAIHAGDVTKLNELVKNMKKTVASMPKPEKQSSGWFGSMSGFRSKKVVQVFIPNHTSKGLPGAIEKLCSDMSYKCKMANSVGEFQGDLPLVVVCPMISRLEADIDHTLQDINWPTQFVVMILHYGSENAIQSLPTSTLLNNPDKYAPAIFIDAGFTEEQNIYNCRTNEEAKERIKSYVEKFYG